IRPRSGPAHTIHQKPMPGHSPSHRLSSSIQTQVAHLQGTGNALAPPIRAFFEPRFGRDLSKVRVHTDGSAAETAGVIRARAFSAGSDITFAQGEYAPETREGRLLLAHELVHTFQSDTGPRGSAGATVRRQPDPASGSRVTLDSLIR